MKKNIPQILALCFGVLFLSFLINFIALAWEEPPAAPPAGNAPTPLNVSSNSQQKTGSLRVGGLRTDYTTQLAYDGGSIYMCQFNPGCRVSLNGILQLQPSSQPSGSNGMIYYDITRRRFRCYQNSQWVDCINQDGGITGSGTTNYLAKFIGTSIIGISQIFDNGTNVGIGTASPSQKLDVNGQIRIREGSPGTNKVLTSLNNTGLALWRSLSELGISNYWTQSGSRLYPNSTSWNVGIGTTSPAYKLDVNGPVRGSSLCIGTDCRTSWPSGIGGSGKVNYIAKFTGINAIGISQVFDNGTNIGIGTESPTHKLDVSGQIKIRGGSPGTNKILASSDNLGLASWKTFSELGMNSYWTLNGSSLYPNSTAYNVGIGTISPASKLHVFSGTDDILRLQRSGAAYPAIFRVGGSDSAFVLNVGGGDRLTIKSNGNVGIGTTNPATRLEVNGQIKITGGSPAVGKVLTSDSSGLASWQSAKIDIRSNIGSPGGFGGTQTVNCLSGYLRVACSGGLIHTGAGSNEDNEAFIVRPNTTNGCEIEWQDDPVGSKVVEVHAYCVRF